MLDLEWESLEDLEPLEELEFSISMEFSMSLIEKKHLFSNSFEKWKRNRSPKMFSPNSIAPLDLRISCKSAPYFLFRNYYTFWNQMKNHLSFRTILARNHLASFSLLWFLERSFERQLNYLRISFHNQRKT